MIGAENQSYFNCENKSILWAGFNNDNHKETNSNFNNSFFSYSFIYDNINTDLIIDINLKEQKTFTFEEVLNAFQNYLNLGEAFPFFYEG